MLTDGVDVQYRNPEGQVVTDKVWLMDFANPDNNDWLVVNQFTVVENHTNRRPDLVVFVNGLPLSVIELKNPADHQATVRSAYNQFQTYKAQVPCLFTCNAVLVISDGYEAKIGTLSANWERFSPWRTVEGKDVDPLSTPQLETLIKGVFEKGRFLDLVRSFIVFEEDAGVITKKLAGYHQFHAVKVAVEDTVRATPRAIIAGEGRGSWRMTTPAILSVNSGGIALRDLKKAFCSSLAILWARFQMRWS